MSDPYTVLLADISKSLEGVHASKAAGDPIDERAVIDAENTIKALLAAQQILPSLITDAVIETAKNRSHMLRHIHASIQFGPTPQAGLDTFVQEQFALLHKALINIDRRITNMDRRMEAMDENVRIRLRNRRAPLSISPLKKIKCGDGHDLAMGVCTAVPEAVQAYHPLEDIGSLPSDWNPDFRSYEEMDVLRLIVFYNDTFGIIIDDGLGARREKIGMWLVDEA